MIILSANNSVFADESIIYSNSQSQITKPQSTTPIILPKQSEEVTLSVGKNGITDNRYKNGNTVEVSRDSDSSIEGRYEPLVRFTNPFLDIINAFIKY